ncbi:MAG: rod-determining factor RdfA [Haloarculaceae archaeon]
MASSGDDERDATTKVGRLIEAYGLEGMGEKLERRWTADGEGRTSLRDLEEQFNRQLLTRAMHDAGAAPSEAEIGSLYRSLTGEDVSSGVRTEVRHRLERQGIDVDELENDFVSYQAIRTYLRGERGATHDTRDDEERIENDREHIQRLQARLRSVTEDKLDRLSETDRIDLGEFRLFTETTVLCEECESQFTVMELLERGGCDCRND